MNTTSGIITLKISEWSKITTVTRIHCGCIAATMYSGYFSNFRHYFSNFRHYATSRKVAGSIPDGVMKFFVDIILPAALWP